MEKLMTDGLKEIKEQIKTNKILLYMKGTPQAPECGFSATVVKILNKIGKPYSFVNILTTPQLRSALPKVSDWPTFPQLYVNGEFLGGSDIIEEIYRDGELQEKIDA
jgi:monothiol glutaredoxin